MRLSHLRSRLASAIVTALAYSLVLTTLLPLLTIATYSQSWLSYDLPLGKYVINVKLRLEASNAGTTWDLSKALKLDYSVGLANFGSSLGSVRVLLNLTLVCAGNSVTNSYVLGTLSTEMPATSGYLMIYPPGNIVDCVLRGGSYVLIVPKVALETSNLSKTYILAPYRLYAGLSDASSTYVGRCSVKLSNSSAIEVCVKAPYLWSSSKASNPVTVSVSTYGINRGSAVISIKAGNSILASRQLAVSGGSVEEVINVPTDLLMSVCLQTPQTSSSGKNTSIKTLQPPQIILNTTLTPLATNIPQVSIPLMVRCSTTFTSLKLLAIPSASSVVAGESVSIKLVVSNPNNYPVRLTKLIVKDGNSTVYNEGLTTTIPPQGTFTKVVKLLLKSAGDHVIVPMIKYSIAGREEVVKSKVVILVTRALHIDLSKNVVTEGNELVVNVAAFKPVKGVQLIAKTLGGKGNETKVIAYVGEFPAPTVKKVRLIVTLKPGNYSIYAITSNGLRSNEEILKVVPKEVNKTVTTTTPTKKVSTTATKTQAKTTTTKAPAPKTKAGVSIRVRLLNRTIVPKGIVVAEVLVSGSVSKPEFKLYKYESTFTPPWILQPTARFTQVKPGTYRLTFKAPSSEGNYEYRVVLMSNGKDVAQATFRIVVSKAKATASLMKAALLPPEILIPLVGTVALASIILLRRFRSGVSKGKVPKS